PTHIKWGD
uniref:Angiotensin-converting enzyme inhibitor n=1 Tax=Thunnus albacares TaxID=8236 RepID=ACI_THUAL|nr:RecName: Full=Angiotensin-converting enzyme inhibitor [Thunnus albacares]